MKRKSPCDTTTVAFAGLAGSFTEEAANKYFQDQDCKIIPLQSIKAVFDAVETGGHEFGIVPIENSDSGSLRRTYDLLISHKVFLVGEISLPTEECLIAMPGTKLADVREVYSHQSLLDSATPYLEQLSETNGKTVRQYAYWNTAAACEFVAEKKDKASVAIGSRRAADIYNLEILATQICKSNQVTRYVAICAHEVDQPLVKCPMKTSVVLSMMHRRGALFKTISCFALRDINILKLETRPAVKGSQMFDQPGQWDYLFYLDYEPSLNQTTNQKLLDNLTEYCQSVRILGTYPQRQVSAPPLVPAVPYN